MTIEVLSPIGLAAEKDEFGRPDRLAGIRGATIGLLDNSKSNADNLLRAVGARLREHWDAADIRLWQKGAGQGAAGPAPDATLDEVRAGSDAAVVALGDCGSCSSWSIHDAVSLERRGIPTVTLISRPFEGYARLRAASLGIADLPIVIVRHPIADLTPEAIQDVAQECHERVAQGLTVA